MTGMDAGEQMSERDSGFTLIELLISLMLSAIIAGVTVSAMLTSMNVIDVTTEQISGSTDAGLIATYFYRDAQAAGSTLPSTGQADPDTGVSVTGTPAGWQGCEQPGGLAVRLSWVDHVSATDDRNVVVTYALYGSQLTRRMCVGATTTDLVVGQNIASANATCSPNATCTGAPDRVSLHVTGLGERTPADHTFTAYLRQTAAPSTGSNTAVSAPLVVLGGGGSTACPPLDLSGAGDVVVLGDAVVASGCGSSLVGGNSARLRPTGSTVGMPIVTDPLVLLEQPAASCGAGTNPSPVGASPGPSSVVVYPQPVIVGTTVAMQPGVHVFCNGLTFAPGAIVQGTGVTLVVRAGGLSIDAGAQMDLTAPTTGAFANVLAWSISSHTVDLHLGPGAAVLRGIVYAPVANVVVSTDVAMSLGGLIARSVQFDGAGLARLGLPIPTLGVTPTTVPSAQLGVAFGPVTFAATGGASPYRFASSGLPTGVALSSTGVLSGTPTIDGDFDLMITAIDQSGAAGTVHVPLSVTIPAAINGPATLPGGTTSEAYSAFAMSASGDTAPYTWSAVGLPDGLTLSSDGVLSGTPTGQGTSSVTVTLTDARGLTTSRVFDLTIAAGYAVVGPDTLPSGQVGLTYLGATMSASGGKPPYVWSATDLPPGLKMTTDGQLVGTPQEPGDFMVTVYTSDDSGAFATRSYVLKIADTMPIPANCPSPIGGWRGEYYPNMTLDGEPTTCQDDATIDFSWNGDEPATGVPPEKFSVRWTRVDKFAADTYQFVMEADDGARLFIDGALIIDDWTDRTQPRATVTQALTEGEHTVVMEFVQEAGVAHASLTWAPVTAATCPAKVDGWQGEYFANRDLKGPAELCRDDAQLKFDWGAGSPGDPIPTDEFSVRWTRTVDFKSGTYVFKVGTDDGARLYIDGRLIGEWWNESTFTSREVKRRIRAGEHTIVLEYFEGTGDAAAVLEW